MGTPRLGDEAKVMTDNIFDNLMPTSPLMIPVWLDGLRWAISEDSIVSQFRQETGNQWTPGKTALEAMIDTATGADRDFILAFTKWFNRNIWGEVNGRACNGDEIERVSHD